MSLRLPLSLPLVLLVTCTGDAGGPRGPVLVRKIAQEAERFSGVEASARVGDWLLANERVRFAVQDAGSSTGWGLYGGSLVDADLIRGPGEVGDERLQEIFFHCELRAFAPESAEVVNDGSDGQPAVLRLRGRDRGIPLIDSVVGTRSAGLAMSVDYILAPGSGTLEIVLRADDAVRQGSREITCGLVLLRGDAYQAFVEGEGYARLPSEASYIAAAAPEAHSSYVLWRKDGTLRPTLPQGEVVPVAAEPKRLVNGGFVEERFYVALGAGDVESALAERRRFLGEAEGESVRFRLPAQASELPPLRLTVHAEDGRALTSVVGRGGQVASARLPAGRYVVQRSVEGRELAPLELTVPAGGTEVAVEVEGYGALVVHTTRLDAAGAELGPTPAKLVLYAGSTASPAGPRFLERYVAVGDRVPLPAGRYTAFVSRGPLCELHREEVEVTAGRDTDLRARVRQVVDVSGWVAGDLHVHGAKSVDADAARRLRVLGAAAEGLDILISTDHDIVTDYRPFIEAEGLSGALATIRGIEVSPTYGHMNVMPMEAEAPEAYWRVGWTEYQDGVFVRVLPPDELVERLRAQGARYVQVNHPRGGAGVFSYIDLDPATGVSRLPFPAADAFEVLNGKGGGEFDEVLADFLALMRVNKRLTLTGVSDAHGAYDALGYARTLARTGKQGTTGFDADEWLDTVKAGKAIALSGPMVTLTAAAGGRRAEIGDTLVASGPFSLELTVQAPSWMDVGSFRILENGAPILAGELTPADQDPANPALRLRRTFTATATADAYYMAIVEGRPGTRNEPVIDARARTVTNPILVDTAGDGFRL